MAYTSRPTTFADEYFQHGQMYVQDTNKLTAPTGYIIIAITALEASTTLAELSPENGADGLSVGEATNEDGAAGLTGASGGDFVPSDVVWAPSGRVFAASGADFAASDASSAASGADFVPLVLICCFWCRICCF